MMGCGVFFFKGASVIGIACKTEVSVSSSFPQVSVSLLFLNFKSLDLSTNAVVSAVTVLVLQLMPYPIMFLVQRRNVHAGFCIFPFHFQPIMTYFMQ
jgi:energy-converting hydrogenase Eha subunit E